SGAPRSSRLLLERLRTLSPAQPATVGSCVEPPKPLPIAHPSSPAAPPLDVARQPTRVGSTRRAHSIERPDALPGRSWVEATSAAPATVLPSASAPPGCALRTRSKAR